MTYVLLGGMLVALVVCALGLLSIAAALTSLLGAYRRPPLHPGDDLVVRSFGTEQRCMVVDVGADGTVLIAPVQAQPSA